MMKRIVLYLLVLMVLAACSVDTHTVQPGSSGQQVPERPFALTEDLLAALRSQGLTVELVDTVARDGFFGVPLQIVAVNRETEASLRLYIFADEALAARAADGISPDGSEVNTHDGGTAIVEWIATPHFFRYGQVIANYTGDDPVVMRGLENVFGPQFAGGSPVMVQAEPEELARKALQTYLTQLHARNYDEAAFYYGGDYDWLREINPDVPQDDAVGLLARGCEVNGLVCLNIASLELAVSADETYTFLVQFANGDGSMFALAGCCGDDTKQVQDTFEFPVISRDGQYLVLALPPYQP